ncbi:hypothetical protein Sjap_004547 [Stephania japonica]|uniref:Uncharacterized protein n=1 Tax=Stephania japonica TaxID=461633 RepID=A0AAP0K3I4_9MAGN
MNRPSSFLIIAPKELISLSLNTAASTLQVTSPSFGFLHFPSLTPAQFILS